MNPLSDGGDQVVLKTLTPNIDGKLVESTFEYYLFDHSTETIMAFIEVLERQAGMRATRPSTKPSADYPFLSSYPNEKAGPTATWSDGLHLTRYDVHKILSVLAVKTKYEDIGKPHEFQEAINFLEKELSEKALGASTEDVGDPLKDDVTPVEEGTFDAAFNERFPKSRTLDVPPENKADEEEGIIYAGDVE